MMTGRYMGFLWLRDEIKLHEQRTLLVPQHAEILVHMGHKIVVERSQQRIFPDSAYEKAGCELVPSGSWIHATTDYYILGLRHLPENDDSLRHKHIYFAHCYKNQRHGQRLLQRFHRGGGTLFDCEYLTDAQGVPLVMGKNGQLSGYIGVAMALQFYVQKHSGLALKLTLPYFSEQGQLVAHTKQLLHETKIKPSIVILGYQGNTGSGAVKFCKSMDILPTLWGRAETNSSDLLSTLNQFEIIVNCIRSEQAGEPFLLEKDLYANKRLSILVDVTCDVDGPMHRFPFYSQITTFDHPCFTLGPKCAPVDVIAIDHLPNWLPIDASHLLGDSIFVHLQHLLNTTNDVLPTIWENTHIKFLEEIKNLH